VDPRLGIADAMGRAVREWHHGCSDPSPMERRCRSSMTSAGPSLPSTKSILIAVIKMSRSSAAALGLGGAEVNPLCFQPFGGYGDDMRVVAGATEPPTVPGIGFELKRSLRNTFEALLGDEPSVRL
jgi:hypothetical protein